MEFDLAPNALTTYDRLIAAGFGGGASEDSLTLAINAVSAMVEDQCDRVFREIVYTESPTAGQSPPELVQGSGRRLLLLSTYPVLEVTQVKIDGVEIEDWQLLPREAAWGALYRRLGWPRREGRWGSLVCDPDGQADYNVSVSYRGGFSAVPADLELAVMQEVDLVAGGSGGQASRRVRSERTPGGWSISYGDSEHACSMSSQRVFGRYRRKDL